jgi:pre-mRNA-splicing factor ATP-dependent RNA helicase DHX38/PRP16
MADNKSSAKSSKDDGLMSSSSSSSRQHQQQHDRLTSLLPDLGGKGGLIFVKKKESISSSTTTRQQKQHSSKTHQPTTARRTYRKRQEDDETPSRDASSTWNSSSNNSNNHPYHHHQKHHYYENDPRRIQKSEYHYPPNRKRPSTRNDPSSQSYSQQQRYDAPEQQKSSLDSRFRDNHQQQSHTTTTTNNTMQPPPPKQQQRPNTQVTNSTASSRSVTHRHPSTTTSTTDTTRRKKQDNPPHETEDWDVATPSPPPNNDEDDNDNASFDRQFYLQEDEGHYVMQDSSDMGRFLFENSKTQLRQQQQQLQKAGPMTKQTPGSMMQQQRQSKFADDQRAWEENRLRVAGAMEIAEHSLEIATEQETHVTLLVHQVKPPFLLQSQNKTGGGAAAAAALFVAGQQQLQPLGGDTVGIVKDPSSDLARAARLGSTILKERKAERDKHAMRHQFWKLGSDTRMGKIMGVKQQQQQQENNNPKDDASSSALNYKQGYAEHMNKKDSSSAVSEFAKTKSIQQQREFLPIYTVREELVNVIRENNIVVIVGETGSGKTTQLTQFLYEEGYCEFGTLIGCTQPRRVAAMSVAKRVSEEVAALAKEYNNHNHPNSSQEDNIIKAKYKLGGLVGYAIRFEDCTSDHTRIKYMTDGVLLRESLNDPDLSKYSAIIMDEAHERSLNTDVLFGVLRKIVATRRSDLKLIVTSATLSAETFSDFFGGVPVFRIPGRTFPVQTYYAKSLPEDYVMAAVKQALQIHFNSPPGDGDILIFMTGQEDIEGTCEILVEKMERLMSSDNDKTKTSPLLVLPMYSQLPADLQAKIFDAAPPGIRKCIVSTNGKYEGQICSVCCF